MRKIIVGAQLSLDGVMQAPGGPTEDPTKGFQFGGWMMPYVDRVFEEEIGALFQNFDLLLGRKTYEIFAAFWPYFKGDGADGEIARQFDKITKYVVSSSGQLDTSWEHSVLLSDTDAIKRLKQEDGPTLITQGSTALVHDLLASDLVDQISTFTAPVVLGSGKKLFADGSAPHAFKLESSRASDKGVIIAHYEREGAVKINDTAPGSLSEREVATQKRMKREG